LTTMFLLLCPFCIMGVCLLCALYSVDIASLFILLSSNWLAVCVALLHSYSSLPTPGYFPKSRPRPGAYPFPKFLPRSGPHPFPKSRYFSGAHHLPKSRYFSGAYLDAISVVFFHPPSFYSVFPHPLPPYHPYPQDPSCAWCSSVPGALWLGMLVLWGSPHSVHIRSLVNWLSLAVS
jgi:hypothetical protein